MTSFQGVTSEVLKGRLDERKLIRASFKGLLIFLEEGNIDNQKGLIVSLFIARKRIPVIKLLA